MSLPFPSHDLDRVYGPIRKIAYNQAISDVTLSFLCSESLVEKVFFDRWQEMIVGQQENGRDTYNVNYYDQYASFITIVQYNDTGENVYDCQLFEAYPVTVNNLPLNRGENDFHKLQVSFAYHHWKRTGFTDKTHSAVESLGGSILPVIFGAAGAAKSRFVTAKPMSRSSVTRHPRRRAPLHGPVCMPRSVGWPSGARASRLSSGALVEVPLGGHRARPSVFLIARTASWSAAQRYPVARGRS